MLAGAIGRIGVLVSAWAALTVCAPQAFCDYTTIIDNGTPLNRVDVVFLGDGYTAADIAAGTYSGHIDAMLDHLFNDGEDPFVRYRNFFNVHRIDVVSNESGADIPTDGIYRDTALDASYSWAGGAERLLSADMTKAGAALNAGLDGAGFGADVKLVTVNESKYGGGGGVFAVYAGGNASTPEIALHELGHCLGKLADEYAYDETTYTGIEPSAANVTANSDTATVKWSDWLGYEDPDHPEMGPIGLYEGAAYYNHGMYRATENSKMRALGWPFNAVSREEIILQIYDHVWPLDFWRPSGSPLVDPDQLWVDTIDPDVIAVQWYVDGDPLAGATGETFTLADHDIDPGQHEIAALAYDSIIGDWVRRDLAELQMEVSWNVELTPEPATLSLLAAGLLPLMRRRAHRR